MKSKIKNKFKIISWNIRSLSKNFNFLSLLQNTQNPDVILLQETHIDKKISLKNYNNLTFCNSDDNRSSSSLAIYIRNNIKYEEIKITSPFPNLCLKILSPFPFIIANIYLSPSINYSEEQLNKFISQLGHDFIVAGDLNANSLLWSTKTNPRGRIIENLTKILNLSILNDQNPTFQGYHTQTIIDLILASNSLSHNFESHTLSDTYGSDHYPVIAEYDGYIFNNTRRITFRTDKADWDVYKNQFNIDNVDRRNIDNWVKTFTECIINAAKISMPLTKLTKNKKRLPFWNDEIKNKIIERKRLLREFTRSYRLETHRKISNLTNQIRILFKKARAKSWDSFVSGIDHKTNGYQIWNRVNAIKNSRKENSIHLLRDNGTFLNDGFKIAEKLSDHFSHISKGNLTLQQIKTKEELENSLPSADDNHDHLEYNHPIGRLELEAALQNAKGKSPGEDKITYEMIKQLPNIGINELLKILNTIMDNGIYPKTWKKALVIPILKAEKVNDQVHGFRPISLVSVLARIFERIINQRLNNELEKLGFFSKKQTAYRKKLSTMDNLASFSNCIANSFSNKELTVAVFLDIKGAFDTVWPAYILKELLKIGIKGKLYKTVRSFLTNRSLTVVNGVYKSLTKNLENGVPQGSALSCTLFLVAVNNIIKNTNIKCTMYADDLTIWITGKKEKELNHQMQVQLNEIVSKLEQIGFTISENKTCFMTFSAKRNPPEISLKLLHKGVTTDLKQVPHFKLLGITFDSKFSFQEHLDDLVKRITKNNQALRVIGGSYFGGNRNTLLLVNQAINLSLVNYGRMIYSVASPTSLKKLDVIFRKALRICLGTFHTTPNLGLLVEGSELPSELLTDFALLKYGLNILSNKEHVLHEELSEVKLQPDNSFIWKLGRSRPLTQRIVETLIRYDLNNLVFSTSKNPNFHLQERTQLIKLDLYLHQFSKKSLSPKVWNKLIAERLDKYKNKIKYYTDGSKTEDKVGAAWVRNDVNESYILHKSFSVFSTELFAILSALKSMKNKENVLVCSDSLSSLRAIGNPKNRHQLVWEILWVIKEKALNVTLLWIPSHTGHKNNDLADQFAKNPTLNTQAPIPYSDAKQYIKTLILDKFQTDWTELNPDTNKLREIKQKTKPWTQIGLLNRRDSTVITRLRLGHTAITHEHLLNKTNPPNCKCNEPLTVKHIFTCQSNEFTKARRQFSIIWPECLQKDELSNYLNVINYLKEIDFHTKI